MLIRQQPDSLSMSDNLKEFIIETSGQISFVLKKGGEIILSQRYDPGQDGRVAINVRDIVRSHLSFKLTETDTCYHQADIMAQFVADINGTKVSFRVIRCGVDNLADTAANFLKSNFLTWQPQEKPVTYSSPEFLTYYALENCTLKLKAYYTDATGKVTTNRMIDLVHLYQATAYTIPLQYSIVNAKLNDSRPAFYDVWVENQNSERLTYIQRYYASSMLSENEQWILFENSLGGIDTFRAYGSADVLAEHTHNIAEIDEVSTEYRIDTERKFQKNTGYLDEYQRKWLLDFFPSQKKYIYSGSFLRAIVVVEDDVKYTDKELPSSYTFTYKYADAKPLLNLPRTKALKTDLNISIPDLGSFSVPPRLVEFPRLPLSEGALFPVQSPYSEDWSTATAGSIADFVGAWLNNSYQGGGGIGHKHENLDLLQLLSYVDGYLKVNGKKISSAYSDESGVARLLETVGFINSLALGRGAAIFANGHAQLESLEVRTSMKVQELIFNRLSAQEGDFSFSESGTIVKVEKIDDTTYRLTLRKNSVNDFTAFAEHDIVYGMVNNLAAGGGSYYTSWGRVVQKNPVANTITILLYPDGEVPGGVNHPPEPLMVITRRGNPVDEDRQGYWYISSYERCICMLDGVTKPILEEYNYAVIIGRLKNLSIFDNLPINYRHSYIFCRGITVQDISRVRVDGKPVQTEISRQQWSLDVAIGDDPYRNTPTEIHAVYHLGCKWLCLVDKTTDQPRLFSTSWAMVEGNTNLSMKFASSAGDMFFGGKVSTTITPYVYIGHIDISQDIAPGDWMWTRNTGNVTQDNEWAVANANKGRVIELNNTDMGENWSHTRKTEFICTAFVRDGEGQVSFGIRNTVIP